MSTELAIEQSIRENTVSPEVMNGLSKHPTQIAPKYFYDQKGSELFDAIQDLDLSCAYPDLRYKT